jgi:threonine dehydrogenase-like Zn-dependent dehydrogenase
MQSKTETLPRTMRAVVCHGPEDYRLQELPTPQAGPGEVVVKIEAAGICASDVKCYKGAPMFWGDESRQGYCQAPITAGHEFIGTVVALGESAAEQHGLQLGDRAISEQIVPCWKCRYCQRGQYHLCIIHDIYGFHTRTPGGFAEYMKFPERALNHKVPAGIQPEHAALSSRWRAPCMRCGVPVSSSVMWLLLLAAVRLDWAWSLMRR